MSSALVPPKFRPRARTLRHGALAGSAVAAAMLLFAGPALAHITITPESVTAGSAAVLTLHVPNEEVKASTIKVDVQIPTDHPIAQLLVEPVPGWSIAVRTVTLAKPITTDDGTFNQAVSEVIWSGGRIQPGQFQDFTISADPMPVGVSQMVFKAIQTYSDGDVVRWIDLPQRGQPAPGHPAPTVTLTTAAAQAGAPAVASAPASSGSDGLTRALAAAGLLAGLLAVLLALSAGRKARRQMARIEALPVSPAATNGARPAGEKPGDRLPVAGQAGAQRDQAANGSKTPARRDHAPSRTKPSARRSQSQRRG